MRRAAPLLALLLLAGCGTTDSDRTDDVREFLRVNYEFETSYESLGTVTVHGDEVEVVTDPWYDPAYGAYLYCAWVENWVRRDQDDPDMDIVVRMGDKEILRARGASETCADAEPTV